MSDDRDLATRLAAIEATPRPRWVMELRTDLTASWDTGELPVDTVEPARRARPRLTTWSWRLVGAAVTAAACITAFVVLADGPDHIAPQPGAGTTDVNTSSPSTSTITPTTEPVVASSCGAPTDTQYTYTDAAVWAMRPLFCDAPGGHVDVMAFDSQPFDGGSPTHLEVEVDDLKALIPELDVASSFTTAPWGDLSLTGATTEAVYFRVFAAVFRLDIATGALTGAAFEAGMGVPAPVYGKGICLVGRSAFVVDFESASRVDFTTGTVTPVPLSMRERLASCGGFTPPTSRWALPVPDAIWSVSGSDSSTVSRMTEDGSFTNITVEGSIHILYPGNSTLWALMFHPGEATTLSPATPSHLMRLDPMSGKVLAELPNPPNSYSTAFQAFPSDDGILAVSDRYRAWWVGNDGTSETLAPLDFSPLGVVGTTYFGFRDDGSFVTGDLASLPRVTTTCAGANPAGLALTAATASEVVSLVPDECSDVDPHVTGFTVVVRSMHDGSVRLTSQVLVSDILAADPGLVVADSPDEGVWGNLAIVGATPTTVVIRTDRGVVWIDLATGAMSNLGLPRAESDAYPATVDTPVLMIGDGTVFAVVDGRLLRADPAAGTFQQVDGLPTRAEYPQVLPTLPQNLPAAPGYVVAVDGDTRSVVWVNRDGVIRSTPPPNFLATGYFPTDDGLWAVGRSWSARSDVMTLALIDPTTGDVLAPALGTEILCMDRVDVFVTPDGALASCLWLTWVGTDGTLRQGFRDSAGTPVGVLGDALVVLMPDGRVTTESLDDLFAAQP